MKTISELREAIQTHEARSAWEKGVQLYALELLDNLADAITYDPDALANRELLKKAMLKGADTWTQYCEGGCSLCYDGDIAARVCTPSDLKRTRSGVRNPNRRETWLDVQARALCQAARWIVSAYLN